MVVFLFWKGNLEVLLCIMFAWACETRVGVGTDLNKCQKTSERNQRKTFLYEQNITAGNGLACMFFYGSYGGFAGQCGVGILEMWKDRNMHLKRRVFLGQDSSDT